MAEDQSPELFAGVELGGTKCVCLLASGPADIRARETVPTTTPAETLGALRARLEQWAPGFAALGIASFGPLDLDPASPGWGRIAATPKPGWRGIDVAGTLGAALGVPVAFDTDVNGAALAEIEWGAGRGLADFAYVTVGTGIGVGLIVGGRPTRGFGHCELGHLRVPRLPGDAWPGACPYHRDCVEGLAAGGAIARRAGVAAAADLPDDHSVWDGVVHALAQLCHALVCAAAPCRIAIGGGIVSGRPFLLPRIEATLIESLAGYVTLPAGGRYVVAPELGELAGPLGAIALARAASPPAGVHESPSSRR
ncbi:MAG: fructokinase [Sphingomonadales bacterium]|jgi:fructokinase|nr:fructokinase [Sphingomonadales bacterium]